jgi:hypothetical protein
MIGLQNFLPKNLDFVLPFTDRAQKEQRSGESAGVNI